MSPPAVTDDDMESSTTGSDGASSAGDQQEAGPGHVESSKTWSIPTATFRPKPEEGQQPQPPHQSQQSSPDSSKTTKNPKIHIPKIPPMSTDPEPSKLAVGLEGRYVDEFGNILDWDGTVLGRVEGDLPSMVGRPVSKSGEILDIEGEVVGYVAENYTKPTLSALGGGLKVDSSGNIYDGNGNIVGKLNDTPDGERLKPGGGDLSGGPPKSAATPSPSEIYLDVKSTHDGIQLIIKIPTVFNREQDRK